MEVWVFESAYFGIFEVWSSAEKWRAHYANDDEVRFVPYDTGWNMYIVGRHSPVGTLRPIIARG